MGSERKIGDDAVRKATGRGWGDWLAILDAAGGTEKPHAELARHLERERGVSPWWAQTITVRYELERGLREEGQRGKTYEVGVSRVVRADPDAVFEALTAARHWNRRFTSKARVNARPGGRYSNADGDRGEFLSGAAETGARGSSARAGAARRRTTPATARRRVTSTRAPPGAFRGGAGGTS